MTLWKSRINRKQGRKQLLKLFTGGCCLWQTRWDSCESHGQWQAAHGTRFRIKPAHFSDPQRPPGLTTRDRWSVAMAPVWGQNLHVGEPSTCQAFIWAPCNAPWERLCQRNSDDRNLGLWLEDSFEPGMVTLTYDLGTDLDGMELFQWVVCCLSLGGLAGGKDGFCFFGTMLSASAFLLPLITLEWSEKHHLL